MSGFGVELGAGTSGTFLKKLLFNVFEGVVVDLGDAVAKFTQQPQK